MGRERDDESLVLDGDDVPEPIERDGDWLIAEADFAHAILWKDAKRMRKGTFEPGDIAKLQKFLRLSDEEMSLILGDFVWSLLRAWDEVKIEAPASASLSKAIVSLLTLAIRHPGAFRRLVKR